MNGLQAVKAGVVFFLLAVTAWTDLCKRRIPNRILGAGLLLWAVFFLWNCIKLEERAFVSMGRELAGSLLLVFGLCCLAVLSRYAIGFGDVKLLGITALYVGAGPAFCSLCCGLLMAGGMAGFLLAAGRISWKDRLPLAPFFFLGYVLQLLGITGR